MVVTLSKIRDINCHRNVEFPGIYTLSGNSNILQALNVASGQMNGNLRKILIKRKNKPNKSVDLYQALIFGDIENIPFLIIETQFMLSQLRILLELGMGLIKLCFEMNDGETIQDLINYAGGLKIEALDEQLDSFFSKIFESLDVNMEQYQNYSFKI